MNGSGLRPFLDPHHKSVSNSYSGSGFGMRIGIITGVGIWIGIITGFGIGINTGFGVGRRQPRTPSPPVSVSVSAPAPAAAYPATKTANRPQKRPKAGAIHSLGRRPSGKLRRSAPERPQA